MGTLRVSGRCRESLPRHHVGHDDANDDERLNGAAGVRGQQRRDHDRGEREPKDAGNGSADPDGNARTLGEAGEVRRQDSAGRAQEDGRERRAAAEAAKREAVRDALAQDQQGQGPERPRAAFWTSPGNWFWPSNST